MRLRTHPNASERIQQLSEQSSSLMLAQHPHTNILTVYGIVIDAADLKLVMQYCRGGSLDKHLAKVDEVRDCAWHGSHWTGLLTLVTWTAT